jgi:hypothetical protein
MENYLVLDANGKVVGTVSAINGDTAWTLATFANPTAARLKPTL